MGVVMFWERTHPAVLVHEIGHHFGLAHNFEGGCVNNNCHIDGDGVCDTPPKSQSDQTQTNYFGNPQSQNSNNCDADEDDTSENNPFRAVALGGIGGIDDGNENFMYYSGYCRRNFTAGQKERMRTSIVANRAS